MPLMRKTTFLCVDCETTGLDPEQDRIIEVGAVRFTFEDILDRYETLVDPECEIPEESIKIHKITDKMLAGKPKIREILPSLLSFLKEGLLIGHNILFDLKMIEEAAKREGIPCSLTSRPHADTLRLARLYGQCPVNSLEALRKHFNIPAEAAHRAMDDAYINALVFNRLSENFKTTEQLFEALEKPIKMNKMPLGPHKGRSFREVPTPYLQWAAHRNFDQDLLYSIRLELRRRKSGETFESGNPFGSL
ncbi:MAG: DUF3820 family protein [Verrucomicrobia bacterium]|nr:DUF3820 family protein [Verrucomicrobiota bacterium]